MISYDISYVHVCIRFAGLPEGRTYVELLNKVWICTSNILSNYYTGGIWDSCGETIPPIPRYTDAMILIALYLLN